MNKMETKIIKRILADNIFHTTENLFYLLFLIEQYKKQRISDHELQLTIEPIPIEPRKILIEL